MFTSSTKYVFEALRYINANGNGCLVRANAIADDCDIPLEYLSKLLQQLVKYNILQSKRGPAGGYKLTHPLSKISTCEVIKAVEGPMSSKIDLPVIERAVQQFAQSLEAISVAKALK